MGRGLTIAAIATATAFIGVGAARAAPSLEIRGAALRVTVIPEARSDIVVTLVRANPGLPLRIRRLADHVFVTGDVSHRVHGCDGPPGQKRVAIWGRAPVAWASLPQLIVHAPLEVKLLAGDAVFGSIDRAATLDLTNQGCGDWTIADVQGRLRVNQSGSGGIRVGASGAADLSVIGSGGITAGAVRGSLTAVSSGSGDIVVASVSGPFDARVGGSGGVRADAGVAAPMSASIAGSGAVRFAGLARGLSVSIAGSGDVVVRQVAGPVRQQVFGRGKVRIGP